MTVRFYVTGLKGMQAQGWRILAAENGAQAAEILRLEKVDVVVTDLHMPVMDGYHLIALIHAHYPGMPVIVLTALPEGEPQDRALSLGALRVLSKPVRLSLLMEEIRALGEIRPAGRVQGLGLSSLLQLLAWEGRSLTLNIQAEEGHGHLYVKQGALIHAEQAQGEGLEAAYGILCWSQPSVTFVEACRVEPTISMPIEEFLMNAAVYQDHRDREAVSPPPVAVTPDAGAEVSTSDPAAEQVPIALDPWSGQLPRR